MSAIEMLNWAYAQFVDGADSKRRRYLDAVLEGRVGPNGGIIIDDPSLPENLQGMEAPSWYDADEDPFSKTIAVPN